LKLAAIGPGTAEALRDYYLEADLVPQQFNSEGLAAALKERAAGQRVLLARADRGQDLLRQVLSTVAAVDQVAVYSQVDAVHADPPILDRLRRGEIDYVTATSSNIARSLAQALDAPARAEMVAGRVQWVSISPYTSGTIRELGFTVAAEAVEYTVEGVIEALIALASREKRSEVRSRGAASH
jgi:uroporphyrinogen III methyltransferase/synthase